MWFIFHWAMYSPKKNKCSNEIEGQDKNIVGKLVVSAIICSLFPVNFLILSIFKYVSMQSLFQSYYLYFFLTLQLHCDYQS